MATKSSKEIGGTSFHGTTLVCTPNELVELLGQPTYDQNTGEDKTNLEWVCETEQGNVFTIYDWKEYRMLEMDEEVVWHLGGFNGNVTRTAHEELVRALKKYEA